MKQRNKYILLVILLLLFMAAIFFFLSQKQKAPAIPAQFLLQDSSTTITADRLTIKVWDFSAVDGDTVNIIFDGKTIFSILAIQDSAVVYTSPALAKGEHWIGVEAINEGSNAPATPHISVGNGTDVFEFDVDSYIGKPAARKIIVQ